jgi:hypothetical protein
VGLYDVVGGVVILVIDLPMTLGSRLLGITSALLGLLLLTCLAFAWRCPSRLVVVVAKWSCTLFVVVVLVHFLQIGIVTVTVAFATAVGLGIVYAILCLCLGALVRRNLLTVRSE